MKYFSNAAPEEVGLDKNLTSAIDAMMEKHLADGWVTSESVQIICKDKVVYRSDRGYENYTEKRPLKGNSLFRMASMTKPVITVCVMLLVEEGKIDIEDPIEKYMPVFKDMQVAEFDAEGNRIGIHPSPRPITIHDLLSHSNGLLSGMHQDKLECNMEFPPNCILADKIEHWANSYLAFDPGTQTDYSWLIAFDVLARLVEMLSGMTIAEFAQKRIFDPLEMTDSTFHPTEEQWNRAVEVCVANGEGKFEPQNWMDRQILWMCPVSYESGAGGLVSSIDDYSRFAHMLCNDGISCGVRIMKEETARMMHTLLLPSNIPGNSEYETWGLGVRVITKTKGKEIPMLPGVFFWSGAYATFFWCDPDRQMIVVFGTNMMNCNVPLHYELQCAVYENIGTLSNEVQ